ncbi:MAG: hypothetical protein JWP01_2159 [Myxococcales bacterium]|nr:hypothetical protein [Myxococcales bacterium]
MRRPLLTVLLLASTVTPGCGDDGATPVDAGGDVTPMIDAPPNSCQSQGAIGQFIRRAGNPRVLPGTTFTDGKIDTRIADPDVQWDATAQRWIAYWGAGHGASYTDPNLVSIIRRATSADRMSWTLDDEPAFAQSTSPTAWDRVHTDAPTVVYNPAAPADRRYLMLYAGADGAFPHPGYTRPNYQIGAAFSADGRTFTRVPAAQSPHGKDGLVLTGLQVFPTGADGIVSDPEVVLVDGIYHLYFSSLSCSGATCATIDTFGVSHATSPDGITWTIEEAPVRSLLRTSLLTSGGEQPSVIYDAIHCTWEIWLRSDAGMDATTQPVRQANMIGVYKADSEDGMSWHANFAFNRDLTWDATAVNATGEDLGMRAGADIAANGNGRLMLYVGYDDDNVPTGFTLPLRAGGTTPGVSALNIATRDLP